MSENGPEREDAAREAATDQEQPPTPKDGIDFVELEVKKDQNGDYVWTATATVSLPSNDCQDESCKADVYKVVNGEREHVADDEMDRISDVPLKYSTNPDQELPNVASGDKVLAVVEGVWRCPYVPNAGESGIEDVP